MKTPGLRLTPAQRLEVQGLSVSCQPYALEIPDPDLAQRWAKLLSRRKYVRFCFGYEHRVRKRDV